MPKAKPVKRKPKAPAAKPKRRAAKAAPAKRGARRSALSRELVYFDGAFNGCW